MGSKGNFDIYQKTKGSTLGKVTSEEIRAYEDLANAIVVKAIRDYQNAEVMLHFNPNDIKSKTRQSEVITFFRSKWFGILTTADYKSLMRIADKQIKDIGYEKFRMLRYRYKDI